MNPLYFLVADRAQHRCEYCRAPELIFNIVMEVEHIIPVAKGGSSSDNNLALACRSCNGFKGIRSSYIDSETGQEQRFYHPRQDQWADHFSVNIESGEIFPLTVIGQATIAGLKMNSRAQLVARRFWSQIGLFP
jgi:HNH endonuclease